MDYYFTILLISFIVAISIIKVMTKVIAKSKVTKVIDFKVAILPLDYYCYLYFMFYLYLKLHLFLFVII